MNTSEQQLKKAMNGDIQAFESLFSGFHQQLRTYLYRLLADRSDAEDLAHDTFIKAFDKIQTFKGEASFKTWVFKIATFLAYDYLKKYKRWPVSVKEESKQICLTTPTVFAAIDQVAQSSGEGAFEMRDHINQCFTCMGKTLAIERQVALILKDVYDFSIKEIASILNKTNDVAKHLVQDARHTMIDIFDNRCALINKKGVCNQCSELNGWFNPKQNQQEALQQLDLVKGSTKYNREELYSLRMELVRNIDPLKGAGATLQDILHRCDRLTMGEIDAI